MKHKISGPTGLSIIIIILLLSTPLWAANRLVFPGGVQYHRFASTVEGPEAAWINPAALGYSRSISAQITGEIYDGKFAGNWGISTVGDGIGISYRHLDDILGDKYDEYIFAAGFRIGHGLYAGASYLYIKEGPDLYDDVHTWNIGLLVRQNPKVSLAAVFSNLNGEEIDGQGTDIEQLYSISYKLFRRYMDFSVEMSLSEKQSLSGAKYNYGVDLYPIPGLMGYFNFDSDEKYELGFRINLTRYFGGLQSRLATGGVHRGTTLSAGISSSPQTSIMGRRR